MKVLFVKRNQSYPRTSGHDVHGYFMMRSMHRAGAKIGLLTASPTSSEAVAGVALEWQGTFDSVALDGAPPKLPRWQEKFRGYWGIDPSWPAKVHALVEREGFDAVVVVGLDVLPYLGLVKNAKRVWYAADEWFLHHLTLVDWKRPGTFKELKVGLIKGVYERVFNTCTDRVWAVSKRDMRFLRWVMGARHIDLVPNGVDAEYFAPRQVAVVPDSLTFWGRLDFEPNIDAIHWFGSKVWMDLKRQRPSASWTVYGVGAGREIRGAKETYGFELIENLPDLRDAVSSHQVAVLPFVSGAGIKNKLLEGAAMALPMIASEQALTGLDRRTIPFGVAKDPTAWRSTIIDLWDHEAKRRSMGEASRQWVLQNHSWDVAARIALEGLRAK